MRDKRFNVEHTLVSLSLASLLLISIVIARIADEKVVLLLLALRNEATQDTSS